ncbi:putative Glycopeptide antibiotics resistance protein [Saccharopolyspora erythraea NRRL 2338]|uniref:Glycopeptide antibiotics resistance protein n=2 Tax=Saccharopolyspora erythraea TaxID=1836 RepID=A4FDS9_SACEN|nr:putative Glycopeptide antibiotics resistance protein [Saccharopolyspora erythraea NRRL 2338]
MAFAVVLAVAFFVPFVVREYRRHGELGAGAAFLRFAALLYVLALACYVLSPFPPLIERSCEIFGRLRPQWRPLAGFDGVRWPASWQEAADLLVTNGSVQQFALNVVLFVPLGVLLRRSFRLGMLRVGVLGFAVSPAIELTQLTGVWGLYPCPYRMFDVDDLIANTAGALAGRIAAPAVLLVPGRVGRVPRDFPRPVSRFRRLTGMSCDLLLLWWTGGAARHVVGFAQDHGVLGHLPWLEPTALWTGPLLLLLLALAGGGSTLGQRAVLLRSARPAGVRLPVAAVACRWLVDVGGLGLAQGALHAAGFAALWLPLTLIWAAVHGWGVLSTPDHRGLSGRLAGLCVVDARIRPRTVQSEPREAHRGAQVHASSGKPCG